MVRASCQTAKLVHTFMCLGVSGSFSGLQFTPLLVTALHQYTMVLQQALTTSAVFPECACVYNRHDVEIIYIAVLCYRESCYICRICSIMYTTHTV